MYLLSQYYKWIHGFYLFPPQHEWVVMTTQYTGYFLPITNNKIDISLKKKIIALILRCKTMTNYNKNTNFQASKLSNYLKMFHTYKI